VIGEAAGDPDGEANVAELEDAEEQPPVYVHRRSLSHAPLFDAASIKDDVLSGLTVALVGLPQCLAYAMMSGLPPAYGLATAAVPGAIAAILGRSAQVVTGPTNTTGLLILAALGPWLGESGLLSPAGLPVLATLTVMAGAIRIVGSYAGAAELLRFLPASVLVGFTAGAGILIGVMQLDEALGIPPLRGGGLFKEMQGVWTAATSGPGVGLGAIATTVGTVAALVLGKRYVPRLPVALLAVLAAMGVAWAFGLDAAHGLPLVSDRASIPSGWPPGAMPRFDPQLFLELAAPAVAIVFLGTLELTVTARAGSERPDMKRELRAQGWANLIGAFASSVPASASLTRSALLKLGGARTRLAALSAALTVVPILFFGGTFAGYIPQASLAGVLFVTAGGMIDRGRIAQMWAVGAETRVLVAVTLIGTLTLPLEWAILIGAGLGLAIHLAKTSSPRVVVLVVDGNEVTPFVPGYVPRTVILEVSGDLHYAAVSAFTREVQKKTPPSATRVILDLSHAHEMRYSALAAIERLRDELADQDVTLELAGVPRQFEQLLAQCAIDIPLTSWEEMPGASVRHAIEGHGEPPRL
jgi:SulP family sulfate permease